MLKFDTQICPVCGKQFFKNAQSVYVLKCRKNNYKMCSYTCYKKIKDLREKRDYETIDSIVNIQR